MRRFRAVLVTMVGVLAMTGASASGGSCGEVSINPDPGWPGVATVISGINFTPGTEIFVNFGGVPIATTSSNVDGAFSVSYTIPGGFPVGTTNVFVFDGPANCEDNPSYTVNASPPTTTTTTTATPTTAVTTVAPTTTVAPATTIAVTTTPPVPEIISEPTTTIGDTTTTIFGATNDVEESSGILLVLVGALLGAGLLGAGLFFGRRMGGS